MINRKEASLTNLSVHFMGSVQEGLTTTYANEPLNVDETLGQNLMILLIDNFKEPEYFQFAPVSENLEDNTLFQACSACFDDDSDFHGWSVSIAKYLESQSKHHLIKSGELLIFKISNLLVDDELVDALGFCKLETKDSFLKIKQGTKGDFTLSVESGAALQKVDKACLICNTEKNHGYKILNLDHLTRSREAKYWRDDFLKISPRPDDYFHTKQYIQLTKEFVNDRLASQFDMDKTGQAQVMQRSLDFFKKEDTFEQMEYASRVFQDNQVVEAFRDFREDYQNYKQLDLLDEFSISNQAVKKQNSVFKSVIKLDKNFHIYVHGNKNLIQKGIDENGRKYYVLYYDEES